MLTVLAIDFFLFRVSGWCFVGDYVFFADGACKAEEEPMAFFDDEPKKKPKTHEVGQDLSALSVAELKDRVEILRTEIARIEAELTAKGSTKNAAEALFRRS